MLNLCQQSSGGKLLFSERYLHIFLLVLRIILCFCRILPMPALLNHCNSKKIVNKLKEQMQWVKTQINHGQKL